MTDYYKDFEYTFIPHPKYGPRFTADDVYAYRNEHQCSIMEAKDKLMREQILEDLNKGRNTHNTVLLYDILEYMIENRYV